MKNFLKKCLIFRFPVGTNFKIIILTSLHNYCLIMLEYEIILKGLIYCWYINITIGIIPILKLNYNRFHLNLIVTFKFY